MRRFAVGIAVAGIATVVVLGSGAQERVAPTTNVAEPRVSFATAHARAAMPIPAGVPRDELDAHIDRTLAADPVAQVMPMLYEQSKEKQLETLYWLRTAPPERIVALLPRLAHDADLTMNEKQQYAHALVDGFIADLEQAGVSAPRF
jgi:hypothetical protein